MAEARAAIAEPHVRYHDEGTSQVGKEKVAKSVFQDLKLCAFRTKKQIANGLWPTTVANLVRALVVVAAIMYFDHPKINGISDYLWGFGNYMYLDESYPYFIRLFIISFIISVLYFIILMYTRQYLLRLLLSYFGWLYQPPRSQSWKVICWALLVRIISGRQPRLYSYQNSLPRMPVPTLQDTIKGFLESVQHLLSKEEFEKFEEDAKDFEKTVGPKAQRILQLKSWWAPNYHVDWWEKYVYLMGRTPITINSNYYCLDQSCWIPTKVQTSRAAGVIFFLIDFKGKIESETLDPLVIRDTIPLCMWQYERMFNTTRIPGEDIDEICHYPGAEHIIVFSNGRYYKMYIVDSKSHPLGILDIEKQIQWIKKDSKEHDSPLDAGTHIAALTSSERTHWAKVRKEHFTQGSNKDSIESIDEALFMVILDDNSFTDMSARSKYLLHGDAKSVWYDKSFNLVVFEDGRIGLNVEHSWADAPVVGHMMEYNFTQEFLYRVYNDRGGCKPFGGYEEETFRRSKSLITPQKLYWDITPALGKIINDAYIFAQKNNDDLQIIVTNHNQFGKGFIKTCNMSPDAFIQVALQLAYYKDTGGKFALTYEACMTRLFLHGRTETVRSFSSQMKEFILSLNDTSLSSAEKIKLMRKAVAKHQKTYRDSMSGKGIDRHLFSLYVVCRGQGDDCPFLKNALTLPWTLSTSQQPQQQMHRGFDIGIPEVRETICPGGGFGPVADNGYGVSYMVPDDAVIYFHVSSKISSTVTNSVRFVEKLFESMQELKTLFEDSKLPGPK